MQTQKEIINIVKQSLVEVLNVQDQELRLDSHLRDELGLDSLSSMEFLVLLEEQIPGFTVNAETIEARSFNTVETISNYVCSELRLFSAMAQ